MIFLNGEQISTGHFPNGESYVSKQLPVMVDNNVLEFTYRSDSDLVQLGIFKGMLSDLGHPKVELIIRYLPYSRMDRDNEVYAFSLKYVAQFINILNFTKVTVIEPHSNVSLALLVNSVAHYATIDMLGQVDEFDAVDYVLLPDAGSVARYGKLTNFLPENILVADKVRNFTTGNIESLKITTPGAIKRRECPHIAIIDDLCSKGGTFLWAADELRKLWGGCRVSLIVGNCEDTIHRGKLLKSNIITNVYTQAHGILTLPHARITSLEV